MIFFEEDDSDSYFQSFTMSTEAYSPSANKNIENLKKLQKTEENFAIIYDIFEHIAEYADFDAMNFAAKEKYYDVENKFSDDIFVRSMIKQNFQLARLLIEFGGNSSYDHGILNDYDFIRFFLKIQRFDLYRTLFWASKNGHIEIIRFLLTIPGIDVNVKDKLDSTALIYASENGYHEIVKLLLSVPGINANAQTNRKFTALHLSSWNGHHEVVKLLIAVPEVDVNTANKYKWTPLMYASENDHLEIVKLLLTVPGINVNATNNRSNTALMEASREGHHEVVKLLLSVPGIDVNAKDDANKTALYWASRYGHHEVAKLLLAVPGIDINAK